MNTYNPFSEFMNVAEIDAASASLSGKIDAVEVIKHPSTPEPSTSDSVVAPVKSLEQTIVVSSYVLEAKAKLRDFIATLPEKSTRKYATKSQTSLKEKIRPFFEEINIMRGSLTMKQTAIELARLTGVKTNHNYLHKKLKEIVKELEGKKLNAGL
jgi:hypothetical protein